MGVVALDLPDGAWCAALASLPEMGPARLLALVRRWPPVEAWARVLAGDWISDEGVCKPMGASAARLAGAWRSAGSTIDVVGLWRAHCDQGIGVAVIGSAAYPVGLVDDPEPAAVLFSVGDPAAVAGPRVAIVGTRSATRAGVDTAYELGRDLAAAGVGVVSGLALGIDGAAHAGALDAEGAPPIAVVGSGLDIVYPRAHRLLWSRVAERGVILSEAPLGAPPARWRFPARNRLLAGLADVVVVVESAASGGSLHTVAEALRRDRTVMAVPGPVRSSASRGTNRLLSEGAAVARDATDVLVALGLSGGATRPVVEPRAQPVDTDQLVLDAVGWAPTTADEVANQVDLPLAAVALGLQRLEAQGWVERRGAWIEQIARPER